MRVDCVAQVLVAELGMDPRPRLGPDFRQRFYSELGGDNWVERES